MAPGEYPDPERPGKGFAFPFDQSIAYGPILPAVIVEASVTIAESCGLVSDLPARGATRSGPFFHLAGIAGDDPGVLEPGRRYQLTLCVVYRREHFGFIGNYYVYVSEVR